MKFDVLVIGAGHAGLEAALAAARMGAKTCLLTSNLDRVGHMSCNPAIGGLAKGQLVKEIDALGGEMGIAIDETGIHFKRLNTAKGPAVWSSRAQADKVLYARRMKAIAESTPLLHVKQGMAASLILHDNQVFGAITEMGEEVRSGATIITTGTFLNGLIHIGNYKESGGRVGDIASISLSESLKKIGFQMGRMKTGTVPRIDKKSINFNILDEQKGDSPIPYFSFFHRKPTLPQISCFITYTNETTHEVIRKNIIKSAMYSGQIQGIGPRYCPCIEDKVMRFTDKTRHQIFLEPEGLDTQEVYPNGLSNSLPLPVQIEFLRTIQGLENVQVMRPGYAIEYDYVDPLELYPWLETKKIQGLFHAGQINGTSGYEEAAAQGLIAGINAVQKLGGRDPFVLSRSESYIGVLIDDLVTKGTIEPYRMFTSRAEHRLYLREDNADQRLHEYGWKLGLIDSETHGAFGRKMETISQTKTKLDQQVLTPTQGLISKMQALNLVPIKKATSLSDLLKRNDVSWPTLFEFNTELISLDPSVGEQIEIAQKYEGYIVREREAVEKTKREEAHRFPTDFDFGAVPSLSTEVRAKLAQIKPQTLGQAQRISGITPAAISILSIYLRKYESERTLKVSDIKKENFDRSDELSQV